MSNIETVMSVLLNLEKVTDKEAVLLKKFLEIRRKDKNFMIEFEKFLSDYEKE